MTPKLFLGVLGAATAGTAAATSVVSNNFTLYAYSNSINGLPLININNTLYVSNQTVSELDNAYGINFTQNTNSISAASNGSSSAFAVPASSGPVVLFDENSSDDAKVDLVTTGWTFFDGTLALKGSSSLQSLFYAVSTDDPNLYLVSWNTTSDKPLALRLPAPAAPSQ